MFFNHNYRMYVHPNPWMRAIEVLIDLEDHSAPGKSMRLCGVPDPQGSGAILFEDCPWGSPLKSTFRISEEDAQRVFDTLYNAGYRPNGGRDSAGVHEAQREHIADLRKVVSWHQGEPK